MRKGKLGGGQDRMVFIVLQFYGINNSHFSVKLEIDSDDKWKHYICISEKTICMYYSLLLCVCVSSTIINVHGSQLMRGV